MKKFILAIILFQFSLIANANELKDSLQGSWLCVKIVNKAGKPTKGKFGASDEYLKFNFNKNKLSITEAPLDPSLLGFNIKYGKDYIDLIPGSVYKIPEQVYFIEKIINNQLILSTINELKDTIYYHFTHENQFIKEFDPKKSIVDLGMVVIKHLKLDNSNGANRVSQYIIPNSREFLNPSPIFKDSKSASFGHYFSINFQFPNSFPTDSLTSELIVEFDILLKEIRNIKIIQGISNEFDNEVIGILEKTKKKWIPLKLENEDVSCRVRIHFVFYLGKMKLGF